MKKNEKTCTGKYLEVVESQGNPNELSEMLSYIDTLSEKSQSILSFIVTAANGITVISDLPESVTIEIASYCKKEVPELEELLNKTLEYRNNYFEKYSSIIFDDCSIESISDAELEIKFLTTTVCLMLDSGIAIADGAIVASHQLVEGIESKKDEVKLTRTNTDSIQK